MMRNRIRLAAGIDAGSLRTRVMILLVDDTYVRYLGSGEVESRGWSKSRIADQNAMSESIRLAAREAERNAQISIDAAVVGVGGTSIEGWNNHGVYELSRPREVDAADMSYSVDLACKVRLEEVRDLLHVFPQDF